MPDGTVDTSFYPRANTNSFLDTMSQVQGLKNAAVQNQLLQTESQRQGVGLSSDKIQLAHQGYQWLTEGLASLGQDPRIATPAGPGMLKQLADQGVRQGWLTPEIAQAELANAPTDPAQLPQYVQNLGARALDSMNQWNQIHGVPGTISNGNTIVPVASSPIMGIRRIGADIPMQTSPGERAAPQPGVDDQNRPTVTPMATVLQRAGYNPLNAMPATAPAPSAANQMQPYPQGQAPVQAGSVPMGPPAGTIEAQKKSADISAEKYSTDAAEQTNFQQNILPIQQAYEHIKALGPTGVGPGKEQINEFKSFVQSMGLGTFAGIDPQQVSDFDQGNKYASAAMRANGFTGSDAQLDAAAKASVTMKTSQGAALAVLQKMAAMTRMKNAQVQAFQASGQGSENYSKWAAGWNAKQNGAAYAFDMMEPDQRQKYVKSLSAADQDKFFNSLQTAMDLGLVAPPQTQAPAAPQGN